MENILNDSTQWGAEANKINANFSEVKNTFKQGSKNLFNKETVTSGKYVNYLTGALTTSATYSASDYIPILANTAYTLSLAQQIAFYDAAKVFISGVLAPATFTSPVTAAYIRISLLTSTLDSQQIEQGIFKTKYEPFFRVLKIGDNVTLENSAIDAKVLKFSKTGKNLFNKDEIITGYFSRSDTGVINANATYATSYHTPILPETVYTVYPVQQIAFYNAAGVFISGISAATLGTTGTFTTPALTAYVRVNSLITDLSITQLEAGPKKTGYKSFGHIIDFEKAGTPKIKDTIIVAKEGGDYTTIQAAINGANDSAVNPVTIIIYPGTYKERVSVTPGRYISLIGINRDNCIIRWDTGVYRNEPLNFEGQGLVKNLTIISTYDDVVTPVLQDLYGYAVHCDAVGAGNIEFINCVMKCNTSAAIGIGLHQDQKVKLTNCELFSYTSTTVSHKVHGALVCHAGAGANITGQSLQVKGCIIHSLYNKALSIIDNLGTETVGMEVTFINNVAYCDEVGIINAVNIITPTTGNLSGQINKTPLSFGNNIPILNF